MELDALIVGQVLCQAGAGRSRPGQSINHGVGIEVHAKVGDTVAKGDSVLTMDGPPDLDKRLLERLSQAVNIGSGDVVVPPRVLETLTVAQI